MASSATSFQSLIHHLNHHSFPTSLDPSSVSFKPINTSTPYKLFSNLSSSTSPITTPSPSIASSLSASSTTTTSLDNLAGLLASGDFRQADEVTRQLLIVLAGESAKKRGYVFFSEVQFIAVEDLRAIDELWREHSGNRFGYSVQKRLWEKSRRDFTRFFIKVGWMKKLDTEVEQFNYRAFPNEFIWELKDDTPEGHLPLTNALRGTQLLASILTHPAFEESSGEGSDTDSDGEAVEDNGREKPKFMGAKILAKPDYSF